jgi:hypothetical protein
MLSAALLRIALIMDAGTFVAAAILQTGWIAGLPDDKPRTRRSGKHTCQEICCLCDCQPLPNNRSKELIRFSSSFALAAFDWHMPPPTWRTMRRHSQAATPSVPSILRRWKPREHGSPGPGPGAAAPATRTTPKSWDEIV